MSRSSRRRRKVAEIREDIARGDADRARQRVSDMIRNRPYDPVLREVRAEAHEALGHELDAAADRYLTASSDEEIAAALRQLQRRSEGRASQLALSLGLPPRALRRCRSEPVQARLHALRQRLLDEEKMSEHEAALLVDAPEHPQTTTPLDWTLLAGCVLLGLGCAFVFLVGLSTVFDWIIDRIRS